MINCGSFLCLGFLGTDLEISIHVNVFRDVARKSQHVVGRKDIKRKKVKQRAHLDVSLFSPVGSRQ